MNEKFTLTVPKTTTRRIIFCLPGNNFSGKFLDSIIELTSYCFHNNIPFKFSRQESSVVYYVRNKCLIGDVLQGPEQKPFQGKENYTHLMWIDSDVIFDPKQFERLLNHDKDIVSGIYMMEDCTHFATVKKWDTEYFSKNGSFQFMTVDDMSKEKELFDVSYTGFGFILIKRGVFESMNYPWFEPLPQKIGKAVDFTSEDVAFCLKAQERGYKIWIDPTVRVGHLKSITL